LGRCAGCPLRVPLERLHVATPQQPLSDVLPLMARRDVNQLPVVQPGTLVGVVSGDAIVHYLEVRRSLGVEHSKSDMLNQLSRFAQRTTEEEGSILRHVP
jgi:predicted transcriptional regulator